MCVQLITWQHTTADLAAGPVLPPAGSVGHVYYPLVMKSPVHTLHQLPGNTPHTICRWYHHYIILTWRVVGSSVIPHHPSGHHGVTTWREVCLWNRMILVTMWCALYRIDMLDMFECSKDYLPQRDTVASWRLQDTSFQEEQHVYLQETRIFTDKITPMFHTKLCVCAWILSINESYILVYVLYSSSFIYIITHVGKLEGETSFLLITHYIEQFSNI